VKLPAGILAGACEMTVATWVYLNTNNTTASAWQRIWDFGTSPTNGYMFVAASTNLAAASNAVRFTISLNGNATGAEQIVDGPAPLPTLAWHHVAVVLGSTEAVLYLDGAPVGTSSAVTLRPADLGNAPNNYIGRSQFSADAYWMARWTSSASIVARCRTQKSRRSRPARSYVTSPALPTNLPVSITRSYVRRGARLVMCFEIKNNSRSSRSRVRPGYAGRATTAAPPGWPRP
jgi:hypothetical protein